MTAEFRSPRRRARRRRPRWVLVLAAVLSAIPAIVVPTSRASAAPSFTTPGFNIQTFADIGIDTLGGANLTNFVYLPSGKVLAIGKTGYIAVGSPPPSGPGSWARLTVNGVPGGALDVNTDGDRGLTGLDLATDFATSRRLYLAYNYGQTNCAVPPAPNGNFCGRVASFLVNDAANPTSIAQESIILDGLPSFSANNPGAGDNSHTVGTIIAAPDGTLFVGNGDGSSYFLPEPGPGCTNCRPDQSSFNAQNLDSPRGKIFHINPDGTGVASNPHYGEGGASPSSWRSRVFTYGHRNPFRFSLKPGTNGTLYVGDVGGGDREEIDVARGGENFGWPCYEGELSFENVFAFNDPKCPQRGAPAYANLTAPIWSYNHFGGLGGNAVIGGVISSGSNYGAYNGSYFLGDNVAKRLWTLKTDGNDVPVPGGLPNGPDDSFAQDIGQPTIFRNAPNGNVAYGDLFANRIYEIRYGCPDNNCPPVAQAAVTPIAGPPGTSFHFDASPSYDVEGSPLSFTWDFGDGQGASGPVVDHSSAGHPRQNWIATVTVSDGAKSATASVAWSTLHAPPAVSITPNKQGLYTVGEPVTLTANAIGYNIADQPYAIGGADVRWDMIIHHCPPGSGGCHLHPSTPSPQPTGTQFSTVVPNHGDGDFYLEFKATATDADGLSTAGSFILPMTGAPGLYSPVQPYRLFDTRAAATSPLGTGEPLAPGQTMAVDLSSQPGAPGGKTAVLLNVTTDQPQAAGYVKAFPCGGTEPYISTVNFDPGQTAANLAMVRLPADGKVCFTSFVPTHVIVDVSGWFAPGSSGSAYTTVDPYRVLDTRLTGQTLAPQQEFRLGLAGQPGFPASATAALINLTATNTAAPGYVRAYPCGEEQDVSNVNYAAGQTVANLASVKVAAGGDICFKSYAQTDIVVDLAGWYAPGGGGQFAAAEPSRVFDTRSTAGLTKLAANQELSIQATGALVPPGATSVALNVTAAAPDVAGYVAVYPCGTSPFISNVNYRAAQVAAANLAVVKLPADGRVCFKSFAPTDLVVDLAGWYVG